MVIAGQGGKGKERDRSKDKGIIRGWGFERFFCTDIILSIIGVGALCLLLLFLYLFFLFVLVFILFILFILLFLLVFFFLFLLLLLLLLLLFFLLFLLHLLNNLSLPCVQISQIYILLSNSSQIERTYHFLIPSFIRIILSIIIQGFLQSFLENASVSACILFYRWTHCLD